ncbi:hypothetical protein SDC9_187682 [bioreactor metagenome]|uniref:Uncharacterized protein n=1 Tax=bioreactor metagenome TaxID=1076179 RepID=A0A645HNJ4_9ZZZZ
MHFHRAKVGKNTQSFTQSQQALFRADCGIGVIPFGAAHRAQQNSICLLAGTEGLGGQCGAILIDGTAANEVSRCFKGETGGSGHHFQNANSLAHYFRADAITG